MTDERRLGQRALADLADVPATSRWVSAGSLRLHVLDYGGANLPPLLVIPGITTPAVGMDFVARELTDLARPVVLDVRGRGLSDDGPATLDAFADDVAAVVAGLGLERPVLLGHSMGARIAAVAAARGAVRGSVLVDPPMSGPGRGPYPTTLPAFLEQLAEARRGTTAAEVARFWPRWPERELGLRARWLASCAEAAVAGTHAGFEGEDFFAVWPSVPAPSVLIHGAESPVVTAEGAAEAAEANPAASVVSVAGAGHMVFWDEPATALATTRAALTSVLNA
ncbi:alpha/beta fold hydrolase [Streptomyces profundus]|uniref:alpha/beta fold hydrolase n=1 Tax=Streptomyces profundus TaxID=2867410 RepID=UPI001D16594B|nr:alpha/beta hydrolase [Streptomyces sp. MA3_2.13]UED87927.1 alpha/beta hydrolase [Streptomyces sp. MA3_2.13]